MAKKKKFQNLKTSPIRLNDEKIGSHIEKEQYIQLCRSIELRSPKVTKDLYCKYETRNKPFYMYGPRKVEIVSLEPYITVIHEFIQESEMKDMKKIAGPLLKRDELTLRQTDTEVLCKGCSKKLRNGKMVQND